MLYAGGTMRVISHTIHYGIGELRSMIVKKPRGGEYEPLLGPTGRALWEDDSAELPGERFALDPETGAEGSNYGRVRHGGSILRQSPDEGKASDWLHVSIPGHGDVNVWRVVAGAWCERREGATQVHHINNNGFDNRPSNLLWVSQAEHRAIEQGAF